MPLLHENRLIIYDDISVYYAVAMKKYTSEENAWNLYLYFVDGAKKIEAVS